MSFNTIVEAIPSGRTELIVGFEPPPTPPEIASDGRSFIWTIHPRRRLHAYLDQRRHHRKFGNMSLNDDFRAWRRVVVYTEPGVAVEDDPIITV